MVGIFPLGPHHDYLQYIHHIHLMQMGSKLGCYTDPERKTNYHERCHELKDGFSTYQPFLIGSGASNHMVFSKESFSSLNLTHGPSIYMEDDTQI